MAPWMAATTGMGSIGGFQSVPRHGGAAPGGDDFGGFASPGSANIYGFPYVVVGGDQARLGGRKQPLADLGRP